MYDVVDIEEEVALSDLATYSWMGFDEAIIAKWATRIVSSHLTLVVQVIFGYSFFIEQSF